jgi:hypothetical protein
LTALPLYRQALGADFLRLPEPLQQFHSLQGHHELSGWVEVTAPASFGARVLARCLGAPLEATQGPLRFEVESRPGSERWVRRFPGKTMESHLTRTGALLVERLGAARLAMALQAHPDKLEMQLVGLRFLAVPCPRWLLPTIVAEEVASAGRLHFRVQASIPLLGTVASYRGHIDLPGESPP